MRISLLLIALLLSTKSFAGIYLEPYLGYALNGTLEETVSGTKDEYSYSFLEIGGRAGYGMMGLSAGLDYNMTPGTYDIDQEKPSKANGTIDYKSSNLGVFVNYSLLMFRVWGSYYFSSTIDYDKDRDTATGGDSTGDKLSGSGFSIGAGVSPIPFLSFNLEYRMNTYDEFKDNSAGTTTKLPSSTSSKVDTSSVLLSVSAPFDI